MSNYLKEKVYLFGAGYMAIEYAKVLDALKIEYEVIGRGKESAYRFEQEVGRKPYIGEITNWVKKIISSNSAKVIVAVGVEQLAPVTIELMEKGFKSILVEKPAGLNFQEIENVSSVDKNSNAELYIAYNRRFYASVLKALEIIEEDGGVTSFNFEFT